MLVKYLKIFLVTFLLVQSQLASASLPLEDSSGNKLPSLSPMIKKINPAVVNIATFSEQNQNANPLMNDPFFRRFFNLPENPQPRSQQRPQKRKQAAGSGVIVDAKNGYVVTNYHVIKDADEIRVSLNNGKHYIAKKLGVDPDLDVAVLQIEADDLTAVKLADSSNLEVGDFVVAIGNPFALGQTVTTGIVSALGRSGLGIEGFENFIQTDASINPGNSGGALVNLNGELIGINTAIISPAGGNVGIGFSIPVNMVKNSLEQIIANGEVKRGQIGVGIQDLTPELQDEFNFENGQQGVLITNVVKDSEADDAGLKADDIIVAINDEKTISTSQLRSQISKYPIGSKIKVDIVRSGKSKSFKVKIGETIQGQNSEELHPLLKGVNFKDNEEMDGVEIVALNDDSIAASRGLRVGDVVVATNRIRITNIKEFSAALKQRDDKILLRVIRGRGSFYVVLQ